MVNEKLLNLPDIPLPPPIPKKIITKKDEIKITEQSLSKLENLFRNDLSENVIYVFNETESILQKGPTCGLVTLMMAKKLFEDECNLDLDSLLQKAIELNLTLKGEMFSAHNLELLATKVFSLKATTKVDLKENLIEIIENLIKKNTILVPYDTDSNHEPCLKKGEKAHWCIVLGFAIKINYENIKLKLNEKLNEILEEKLNEDLNKNFINLKDLNLSLDKIILLIENCSKLYFLCKQGKSKYLKLFDFDKLVESNQNLIYINKDKNCSDYLIPECGLKESLSNKFILIEKF